jgi:UDP-hydrolysing UDP-N-acetyl-D-glucosamine 2-epimerase
VKRIAVVTVARSDYSIYRPILRSLRTQQEVETLLIVGGGHLLPDFGHTVRAIEEDGHPIAERVDMLLASGTGESVSASMGLGLQGFGRAYARLHPDIVLTLGDRFEMMSAVLAALPQRIPVAHIHGGELTEGAIDDAVRHAITKLSHLHFASTAEYAQRLLQLGEEPWRVMQSGAPALDEMAAVPPMSRDEVCSRYDFDPSHQFLLVTYHPVTLDADGDAAALDELLAALDTAALPCVVTFPNADAGSQMIIERLRAFAAERRNIRLEANLGTALYFNTMRHAAAMVGNSSSGIIEAASFGLPVVNIGSRQQGRVRGGNVVDVSPDREAILAAIRRVATPAFRETLRGLTNPYGDGRAAERIVERLVSVPVDARLLRKRFVDLPVPRPAPQAVSA